MAPFFARDIIFMAGTLDTASVPANFQADHPINRQGAHRYERAKKFFRSAQAMAREKGYVFNWQFQEVPGVGHSTSRMLYGNPDVRSWVTEGDQRVYNNEDLTDIGAFSLLKSFLITQPGEEEEQRVDKIKWYNPRDETQPVLHQQLWRGDELTAFYDRFPAQAEDVVRSEVWSRS